MKLSNIKTLLFPPLCFWCEEEWSYFCKECRKELVSNTSSTEQYTQEWYLDEVIIWFWYNESIKKCVYALKYKWVIASLPVLIQKICYLYDFSTFDKDKTIVTSVPLHRYKHYFLRWYNQSELLAKHLSRKIGLPYQRVFTKKKWTKSQTKLSRIKRKANVFWTFWLWGELPKWVTTVIIVDDIITTWATSKVLWKLLKKHYPWVDVVWVFIARN